MQTGGMALGCSKKVCDLVMTPLFLLLLTHNKLFSFSVIY